MAPVIWWVRKDLRLGDNPALADAVAAGRPVIPVFILDEVFETYGAAPRWRLGRGVAALAHRLKVEGSRLILRRGRATDVLAGLVAETGADKVRWSRAYDPDQVTRDRELKSALEARGVDAKSLPGHVLFEPWSVQTKTGGFYRVYTPFWRAVREVDVGASTPSPARLMAPDIWPASDLLQAWKLESAMRRGGDVVARHAVVGEAAASDRLAGFLENRIDTYRERRDFPAESATSGLSENLALGEISPRRCWLAAVRALSEGSQGAEHFMKELVWREFAYHLAWHTPHMLSRNWREGWDTFPWQTEETDAVLAWKQGRTGIPFVDAAMREMYVTGTMHNRARMIVASLLTKHLMTHWRVGQAWFQDCLIDWDPASNAMGWQWVAGSGPDAAPYFRVFNPVTQLQKFDPGGTYAAKWIAEGTSAPSETALSYFDAVPRSWGLSPDAAYPEQVVDLSDGRRGRFGPMRRGTSDDSIPPEVPPIRRHQVCSQIWNRADTLVHDIGAIGVVLGGKCQGLLAGFGSAIDPEFNHIAAHDDRRNPIPVTPRAKGGHMPGRGGIGIPVAPGQERRKLGGIVSRNQSDQHLFLDPARLPVVEADRSGMRVNLFCLGPGALNTASRHSASSSSDCSNSTRSSSPSSLAASIMSAVMSSESVRMRRGKSILSASARTVEMSSGGNSLSG